jgi:hypothetical protein
LEKYLDGREFPARKKVRLQVYEKLGTLARIAPGLESEEEQRRPAE